MCRPMLRMSQTEDYAALNKLYFENDLEVEENDTKKPDAAVKSWCMTHGSDNYMAAGITLAIRDGEYIIEGIAVQPIYRKMGLASILLNKAIEEAKSLGATKLYLVARAPGFFRKNGFVTIEREEAPGFVECFTCPQYGEKCHPEVMRLDIE